MITDYLIIAIVAFIAISDLVLIWGGTATYSRRFGIWGSRISFFPYAWGVLGGHFWSPIEAPVQLAWWGTLMALVGIGLVVSGMHYVFRYYGLWGYRWFPLIAYLPGGALAGVLFWGLGVAASS